MPIRAEVLTSFYQDSVVLMRVAGQVRGRPGVREAAAFMGTPANHALLEQTGLAVAETRAARPDDLILAVEAETEAAAAAALAAARELLTERRRTAEQSAEGRPRTLDSALKTLPRANLVAISVPGAYAKFEALRALRRGLHVFLFSDHVPLADEIELKREARRLGRFCMGPDCGTAYLSGQGIGFSNVVPRGRIGIVAASGTGLQAVASRLAALGEGISHGIGVGGRDLSLEVEGTMTLFALGALAGDAATEAVVLLSKPPHPEMLPRLLEALDTIRKPTIVCCLGAAPPGTGRARWVETLDAAADAAVAALRMREWSPQVFGDLRDVRTRWERAHRLAGAGGGGLLGLYTGGTLAHEAQLVLAPLLGPVGFNALTRTAEVPHRIVDLGDDQFTVGRPHPMIDPQMRTELIREAGRSPHVSVLLVDLVLGRASHPDPAAPLAAALRAARRTAGESGRTLAAVASVVGTSQDPQGLERQVAQLQEAGAEVLPANAEAARFAALIARPALASQLLEGKS